MKISLKLKKSPEYLFHPYHICRELYYNRALFVFACGLCPDLATSLQPSCCEKPVVQWFAAAHELTTDVTRHLKDTRTTLPASHTVLASLGAALSSTITY